MSKDKSNYIEIFETKNYSQFQLFNSNRKINCLKLIDLIQKNNLLTENEMIVTKDLFVIDGQHRLAAARFLNLPIYYRITEKLTEEHIQLLQNRKSWSLEDKLNFYCHIGDNIEHYKFIRELYDNYKVPISLLIEYSNPKSKLKCFNNGEFRLNKDKNTLRKLFGNLRELLDNVKIIVKFITLNSTRAFFNIVKLDDYDHRKMLKKCSLNPDNVLYACRFKNVSNIYESLYDKVYTFRDQRN